MYGEQIIPWMDFLSVDHATERVYVRADIIVGVVRGNSGINLHLMGGGVIPVRGTSAEKVRAQIDDFCERWDEERNRIGDERAERRRERERLAT